MCTDVLIRVIDALNAEMDALTADVDALRRDGASLHARLASLEGSLTPLRSVLFDAPGRPAADIAAAIASLWSESGRLGVVIPAAAADALAAAEATGYSVGPALDAASCAAHCALVDRVEAELCGGVEAAPRSRRGYVETVPIVLDWLRELPSRPALAST